MDKQNVVYPYNKIWFGDEKEQSIETHDMGEAQKYYAKVKEVRHKRSYFMWFH